MADDRGVIREVAWRDIFPWLIIFRTFRLAKSMPLLFVATLGVVLAPAGWRVGVGSPDGWLWTRMMDFAASLIAGRNTSRGCTTVWSNRPRLTMWSFRTWFLVSSVTMWNSSCLLSMASRAKRLRQ